MLVDGCENVFVFVCIWIVVVFVGSFLYGFGVLKFCVGVVIVVM